MYLMYALCLTDVGLLCYYIGKGKIVINRKMTDEQFNEIKKIEKKRLELDTKIANIQNFDDGF